MFLIENKAEIAYIGLLYQVAGLCTKARNAHYIRALKQFISSIDDDYKNLRFVGEDLMTDQEAVALVQHGWDPTYVASVYLAGVVNYGEECFEKIRESFVKQNTWYSDATFKSVQNFYSGTYSYSEGKLSISGIVASNMCKRVLERDTEMESMMEKGNIYMDLTDKHVDLLEMFDSDYFPISNMPTVLAKVFTAIEGITVVQTDHLKYHVKPKSEGQELKWNSKLNPTYYAVLERFLPDDLQVLLSSTTHFGRSPPINSFANLKGETIVRWLVPAIAKSMYQIAVSSQQIHRLDNLKDEMKAFPSSIQTEISLIHGHPVDLSDVKLAKSSRNLSNPVLKDYRVVQTGITIDKGLIPEIILSRLEQEQKTLTMKQKFAVTGYRDVVLVSTSRASGGLVIPRAGFFKLFRNHLKSQTLSHTAMPGDIIDAYHLAAVICRGHLGHRKLMERAKYDLGVARLYFKADIEFYARSGRQDVLSKLIPKGYEPRPAAVREVICEMYKAGVDIWGSPSKCWVTLQLETLLKHERSEIMGKRSELNANYVILLDGVECYNQHVRGSGRLYKITTDQNHVHHLVSYPTQGIRGGKATVLHGAVAGRKPW